MEHVLQCLSRCFQYDRTEFVSRDRFEALLLPLVNQVGGAATTFEGGVVAAVMGGAGLM